MACLTCLCRPGFESELAAELMDREQEGFVQARPGSGLVILQVPGELAARRLAEALPARCLVFARQAFAGAGVLEGLPAGDRVSPIVEALRSCASKARELLCESPDDEAGRQLRGFVRQLETPLRRALLEAGWLRPDDAGCELRAHVCWRDSSRAYAGVARCGDSAPWPGGIPRLRQSRQAPSRSALKLDEGLMRLLGESERRLWLKEGMRAVDLGAAPGGWSWLLLRRGLQVLAVDNGPLEPALSRHDLLEHVRVDGFGFRPERPVDWMVCDMVEQPGRVARLVAAWLREGRCRFSLFNLKLPMKKRYAEWRRCREILLDGCPDLDLRFKHLYHDREEVTGFATLKRSASA